ncbi:MAG: Response regulator receiver protein [uncultured bacterium]|nr:MAG: Response regulator receiver protein [uncultured bacterium]
MATALKRVLVVEDEKPMAHALELKLKKSGFDAKAVFDGEEALDTLKKEKFDLVLLDLILPKMDGFNVLQNLKTLGNKTPVIVSSNLGQEDDLERAKTLGAKGYFVKSNTTITEVILQIKKILKI